MDHIKNDKKNSINSTGESTILAHQRTFLAWIRTGLACVGGGIAVARFLFLENIGHQRIASLCGQILVIAGVLIFVLSLIDYRKNYQRIKGKIGYSGSVWAVTALVTILIIVSAILSFLIFT